MNELQSCFALYVGRYVEYLTAGKEEFFLSLCDIDEELLQDLDMTKFTDYHVVLVDSSDYSAAVRLRNDVSAVRIVLLSGEGVKQIDSLKDFNEYSVLSENRQLLWQCLEEVLKVTLEPAVRNFLEVILQQSEISFCELLKYLLASIYDRRLRKLRRGAETEWMHIRSLSQKRLNQNLPMLGIWKSRRYEVPGKVRLKRMIRTSRYVVVESRLTKALMNHDERIVKEEKLVTESLARGDIQRILEKFYYENIEDLLKGNVKNTVNTSSEEAASSEAIYSCSYEYLLMEQVKESIEDVEEHLLREKDQEESTMMEWGCYEDTCLSLSEIEEQFSELEELIGRLNLPQTGIAQIQEMLAQLKSQFFAVWQDLLLATPVCLNQFCNIAEEYTQTYLQLLTCFLTEEKNRYSVCGTKLVQKLQQLFCKKQGNEIRMAYYHPVCIFYDMTLRRMYQEILTEPQESGINELREQMENALVKKLGKIFPVEFMMQDGQIYAIDYTTVGKENYVAFRSIEDGAVYSASDFRIISRQITDYLLRHPFLTQITIALIEINDLGGLVQLVDRIRHISQGGQCNIGRVEFLLLSSKEDELKRRMSQIWDAVGGGDLVRFRFGRMDYWDGGGYVIERIAGEADLMIIADCSVLYHDPRQVKDRKDYNMIRNRLDYPNLKGYVEHYFQSGVSQLPVIWDTLQHIAESREDGFWIWKSREPDNNLLSFINQWIVEQPEKSIILLSSNEHILSDIFRTRYVQAHRRKYNGKNITLLCFDYKNQGERLPMEGEIALRYSLRDFYSRYLELENVQRWIHPELEDLVLEITYKKSQLHCRCAAVGESARELGNEWKDRCREWLVWHMTFLPGQENLLGSYFQELQTSHWYEKTGNLPTVLLVEKLLTSGRILYEYDTRERNEEDYLTGTEADCLEAVKIHELIRFVADKAVLDERAVSQFREAYEEEMLERIVSCNSHVDLLGKEEKQRLLEIQKKIKGEE